MWNSKTYHKAGRLDNAVQEMNSINLGTMAISESDGLEVEKLELAIVR